MAFSTGSVHKIVPQMKNWLGIMLYAWLLYVDGIAVFQMTGFVGVSIVFVVLAWIWWTIVTTSSLQPRTQGEGPSKAKVP